jgi:hypothetical protein
MSAMRMSVEASRHAPGAAWARSGLMALSGSPHGAPVVPERDLMSRIDVLLSEAAARASALTWRRVELDARVLTERAALLGLARGGQESCSRSCRLIEARDGWIAVNLPRPIDRESVPAFVGAGEHEEAWSAIARGARMRDVQDLVEQGRVLGLAVTAVAETLDIAPDRAWPWAVTRLRHDSSPRGARAARPLVLDLSALWAGPLCTHVLASAGARVLKVESCTRPDSVRASSPAMFNLLHAGKASVVLDFTVEKDRAALRALVERADVLVTSARPRAFEQLALAPADVIAANPRLTWVAITADGWSGEGARHIGFGDDAAVAGGLVGRDAAGRPVFLGDALADPLTGLAAAIAACDGFAAGGGALYDVNLRDVAAWVARAPRLERAAEVRLVHGQWRIGPAGRAVRVEKPRARRVTRAACGFGADTGPVLAELH